MPYVPRWQGLLAQPWHFTAHVAPALGQEGTEKALAEGALFKGALDSSRISSPQTTPTTKTAQLVRQEMATQGVSSPVTD